MVKEFKLPELGENIESADVVSVLVKKGDSIEKDQSVIEIETDKANVEVPSDISGKIIEVMVKKGDTVKVGQVILKVEDGDSAPVKKEEEISSEKKKEKTTEEKDKRDLKAVDKVKTDENKQQSSKSSQSSEKEIIEVKLPDLGENIESADVIGVLVKKGDEIKTDQGIIEIETDKATVEVPSPASGKVVEVFVKLNKKAKVGDVLIKLETSGEAEKPEQTETKTVEKSQAKEEGKEVLSEKKPESADETKKSEINEVLPFKPGELDEQPPLTRGAAPAAPSVRRIARELGIDINKVPGSGPGGRISMYDVKAYVKKINLERASGGVGIKQEPLPDFSKFGKVEVTEMNKIRKVTADHLSYAWATIPHVTQFDKADITMLEKSRKEFNADSKRTESKLTITAILLKLLALAIKEFPQFNCSIDIEKKEIIYKKYFNIGVAVNTERGLIVPVIKDVDRKNLTELSSELNEVAKKARDRKISLEELQGGCITITNLGGFGGTYFSPIVNSPEVAILGVSRGAYEPVYNGYGVFEPRLMLPLSLSYDHRIIDGADAIRFLRWVIERLEEPFNMLL